MGPNVVVVGAVLLEQDPGLEEAREQLLVQELVTKPTV